MLTEPLLIAGLPAAITALVAGWLWLVRRKRPIGAPATAGWEGAAAALGLAAGYILMHGWHGLPPHDITNWPPILAVAAAGLALAAPTPWRWFLPIAVVVVAIAAPLLLTIPLRGAAIGQAALLLGGFGLAWLALIAAARFTAERLPDAVLPAYAVSGAVTAGAIIAAASAKLAVAAGGVAAVAGILAILRLLLKDRLRPESAAITCAAIAPMWLLLAHTLTNHLPLPAVLPLAAAPLAAWLAWPLRAKPWPAAIVAALAAGAVAALAFLSVVQPPPAPAGW